VTWELSLAGLLIGVLVGMTGMGGGSLMTPLLVIVFGFKPTVAVGTDILHGAIFKTVGALRHQRLGHVSARLSGWMFLASAPMSLLGVWVSHMVEDRYGDGAESFFGDILGGALVLGGLGLVAKSFLRPRVTVDGDFRPTTRDRIAAVAIGFFGGFIVGLTSVGSGVFFGLTMLMVFPLKAHKVVGTDIFHAAALLYVAGAGHWAAGNVDFGACGWLLLGSIPGVLIGSQFSVSLPEDVLRLSLAAVLLLSGIKLFDPPGDEYFLPVLLALGAVALAVYGVRRLRERRALRTAPS
jgi:uncharacterized membrane protein YfcA